MRIFILIIFLLSANAFAGFNPFSPSSPAPDSITTKGGLLTSNGSVQIPFSPCLDNQIIVWDSAEVAGFKCENKPVGGGGTSNVLVFPSAITADQVGNPTYYPNTYTLNTTAAGTVFVQFTSLSTDTSGTCKWYTANGEPLVEFDIIIGIGTDYKRTSFKLSGSSVPLSGSATQTISGISAVRGLLANSSYIISAGAVPKSSGFSGSPLYLSSCAMEIRFVPN
jgi:hypothetical protein